MFFSQREKRENNSNEWFINGWPPSKKSNECERDVSKIEMNFFMYIKMHRGLGWIPFYYSYEIQTSEY